MPPGRPRSEAARNAILAATRLELAQGGYDRLNFDRIATTAGVSKQTIYRWYHSKNALLAECLLQGYLFTPSIQPHESGDARDDIRAWIQEFAHITQDPHALALIRAAAAAAADDPDVARGFQEQVKTHAREALAARLQRGQEAGELRLGASPVTVAEIIVGALLYRLFTHEEITPGYVRDLTNIVFTGIAPGNAAS